MLARNTLIKASIVAGGESVLLATDLGHIGRKRFARIFLGALEHQMLEKMRETGFAGGLVGAANSVPDHVGDDRRPVIRDHDNLETIPQCEVGYIRCGTGARGASKCSCKRQRKH